jgi:hypothetical protein
MQGFLFYGKVQNNAKNTKFVLDFLLD